MKAVVLGGDGVTHIAMDRALVEVGVDTTIPDRDGDTPLHHAHARGYDDITAIIGSARGYRAVPGRHANPLIHIHRILPDPNSRQLKGILRRLRKGRLAHMSTLQHDAHPVAPRCRVSRHADARPAPKLRSKSKA